MYIRSLTYSTIEYMRKNHKTIFEDLKTSNITIDEYLKEKIGYNYSEQSKFLKPTLNFIMNEERDKKATDFENSKLIYNAFKNLTESQASDFRLWGGIAVNENVYDYLKYRWEDTDRTIIYRVVYRDSGKRGLMYHGIARLWWYAHLTFDEEKEDNFELTEFTFKYPHIMEKMIYRNFSNSRSIRMAIIEGVKKYVDEGGKYQTKKLDSLYKHISLLSGVNLLDIIPQEKIKDISYDFLINM